MNFDKKLRVQMTLADMKGKELSKQTGLSESQISKLRNGDQRPSPEQVALIRAALGCSFEDLMPDIELPKTEDEEEEQAA